MNQPDRRNFIRRISAMIGSAGLAGCGGGAGGADQASAAAAAPTPPPAAPVPPVTPAPTPASPTPAPPAPPPAPPAPPAPAPPATAALLQFTLTSPATTTLAPFCLGQPFKQGDIPSGKAITCDLPNFQAVVLNQWPDGSAKFAVLAGRASLAASELKKVVLRAGALPVAATALSETQLKAALSSASLGFAPFGTVELVPLIGVASAFDSAAGRWSAGRVRQVVAGAEMSSWVYYAPIGGHAHLTAWFEVRLWASGHVEVLPWVENGWLNVAGPTSFAGTLSFSMNGTSRFSEPITLAHHCRTAAIKGRPIGHWAPAADGLQYSHDTAYFQQTRLVPSYLGAVSGALLARQPTSFEPLAQASFPVYMGEPGYHPSIGMLPEWDVAYLAGNGDARAQAAVLVNGFATGRFAIHYRDEKTNKSIRFSAYPDHCFGSSNNLGVGSTGASSTNQSLPDPTGTAPPVWNTSHHPSVGYLAYLVSGWSYMAEETQFSAALGYLKQGNQLRNRSQGVLRTDVGANTTRGAAWSLRTLLQALTVTPDADTTLRAEYTESVSSNIGYYHAKYIASANHPQGVCAPYSDYVAGDSKYTQAAWMEDFFTAAWGYALSLRLPLTAASQTQLDAFFKWKARSIVGRFGRPGVTSEFNFNDAAQYTVAVAASDTADWANGTGPWYPDWGAIYKATLGKDNSVVEAGQLRGAYFPDPSSYWGNLQPALSYAVEHAAAGAAEAYQRMTTASNWPAFVALCGDAPVWSVRPPA